MYLKYGIQLSGNPYFYKMPIEYIAFESANQIKLVFIGLDTRNDVPSKYEIIINLDGTIIDGNSNVKLSLLSLEPDLSQYALKSEIPDVFETKGLTELETGESSANIEAALGIDFASLIEIIRENKTVIVDRNSAGDYKTCIHATGNISSGNGAANLMFFIGTTPTIYQIQYVSGIFALAVDEYEFAKKSDIPSLDGYVTETALDEKGYLTSIPEKYITETELEDKNYATKSEIPDISNLATKEEIPDVSNLATKTEVTEGLANKANVNHTHEISNIIGLQDALDDKVDNSTLSNYALSSTVTSGLASKQDTLVSGTNIRTLNGVSLLGEGNIQLDEGSTDYATLTNKPSINNVELSGNLSFEDLGLDVNTTWEQIQNKPTFATVATSGDYNDLTNTPDLTVYQPITDNSLTTSAKTIPAAINEIKESVDSISDPYEINLTNLLSAEDSESISTAIGGIDNLNATVQDNRIIVGTISNGNVSVSIRILGNVTTLYYLLDSVVGLTLNEVKITNTSGTLAKSVTTHSVLTENMVINSLTSDETTLPLSAAQGKALDNKISSIDVSADITNAINALDSSGQTTSTGEVISSVSQDNGIISVSKKTLSSDDIPTLPQSKITNLSTDLGAKQNATDDNLDTENKTIVGAINEISSKITGIGKIDPNSNGTGEIFNDYANNKATGIYSHAEGHNTEVSGYATHAEGSLTKASGRCAHAEGSGAEASGMNAHAEGLGTIASGDSTHAEGCDTIASGTSAHAEGQYNFDDPSAIHMVGIGTFSDRKNAHVIKTADGSHYIIGIGGYEGQATDSAQSLQEVINSLQTQLQALQNSLNR